MTSEPTERQEEKGQSATRIYYVRTRDGFALEEEADDHAWIDDDEVLKLKIDGVVVAKFTEPFEWYQISRNDWERYWIQQSATLR